MPVLKCPNGKYRIGGGRCMYTSKTKALAAYAAYRAITFTEAYMEYLQFVVYKAKLLVAMEDTTAVNIAPLLRRDVWRKARILLRKNKKTI